MSWQQTIPDNDIYISEAEAKRRKLAEEQRKKAQEPGLFDSVYNTVASVFQPSPEEQKAFKRYNESLKLAKNQNKQIMNSLGGAGTMTQGIYPTESYMIEEAKAQEARNNLQGARKTFEKELQYGKPLNEKTVFNAVKYGAAIHVFNKETNSIDIYPTDENGNPYAAPIGFISPKGKYTPHNYTTTEQKQDSGYGDSKNLSWLNAAAVDPKVNQHYRPDRKLTDAEYREKFGVSTVNISNKNIDTYLDTVGQTQDTSALYGIKKESPEFYGDENVHTVSGRNTVVPNYSSVESFLGGAIDGLNIVRQVEEAFTGATNIDKYDAKLQNPDAYSYGNMAGKLTTAVAGGIGANAVVGGGKAGLYLAGGVGALLGGGLDNIKQVTNDQMQATQAGAQGLFDFTSNVIGIGLSKKVATAAAGYINKIGKQYANEVAQIFKNAVGAGDDIATATAGNVGKIRSAIGNVVGVAGNEIVQGTLGATVSAGGGVALSNMARQRGPEELQFTDEEQRQRFIQEMVFSAAFGAAFNLVPSITASKGFYANIANQKFDPQKHVITDKLMKLMPEGQVIDPSTREGLTELVMKIPDLAKATGVKEEDIIKRMIVELVGETNAGHIPESDIARMVAATAVATDAAKVKDVTNTADTGNIAGAPQAQTNAAETTGGTTPPPTPDAPPIKLSELSDAEFNKDPNIKAMSTIIGNDKELVKSMENMTRKKVKEGGWFPVFKKLVGSMERLGVTPDKFAETAPLILKGEFRTDIETAKTILDSRFGGDTTIGEIETSTAALSILEDVVAKYQQASGKDVIQAKQEIYDALKIVGDPDKFAAKAGRQSADGLKNSIAGALMKNKENPALSSYGESLKAEATPATAGAEPQFQTAPVEVVAGKTGTDTGPAPRSAHDLQSAIYEVDQQIAELRLTNENPARLEELTKQYEVLKQLEKSEAPEEQWRGVVDSLRLPDEALGDYRSQQDIAMKEAEIAKLESELQEAIMTSDKSPESNARIAEMSERLRVMKEGPPPREVNLAGEPKPQEGLGEPQIVPRPKEMLDEVQVAAESELGNLEAKPYGQMHASYAGAKEQLEALKLERDASAINMVRQEVDRVKQELEDSIDEPYTDELQASNIEKQNYIKELEQLLDGPLVTAEIIDAYFYEKNIKEADDIVSSIVEAVNPSKPTGDDVLGYEEGSVNPDAIPPQKGSAEDFNEVVHANNEIDRLTEIVAKTNKRIQDGRKVTEKELQAKQDALAQIQTLQARVKELRPEMPQDRLSPEDMAYRMKKDTETLEEKRAAGIIDIDEDYANPDVDELYRGKSTKQFKPINEGKRIDWKTIEYNLPGGWKKQVSDDGHAIPSTYIIDENGIYRDFQFNILNDGESATKPVIELYDQLGKLLSENATKNIGQSREGALTATAIKAIRTMLKANPESYADLRLVQTPYNSGSYDIKSNEIRANPFSTGDFVSVILHEFGHATDALFPERITAQIRRDYHAARQKSYDDAYKALDRQLSRLKVPANTKARVLAKVKDAMKKHIEIADKLHGYEGSGINRDRLYNKSQELGSEIGRVLNQDMRDYDYEWQSSKRIAGQDLDNIVKGLQSIGYTFVDYGEFAANQAAKLLGNRSGGAEYEWIRNSPEWVKSAIDYARSFMNTLLDFKFENSKGMKTGLDLVLEGNFLQRRKSSTYARSEHSNTSGVEFHKADLDKLSTRSLNALDYYNRTHDKYDLEELMQAVARDGIDPQSMRISGVKTKANPNGDVFVKRTHTPEQNAKVDAVLNGEDPRPAHFLNFWKSTDKLKAKMDEPDADKNPYRYDADNVKLGVRGKQLSSQLRKAGVKEERIQEEMDRFESIVKGIADAYDDIIGIGLKRKGTDYNALNKAVFIQEMQNKNAVFAASEKQLKEFFDEMDKLAGQNQATFALSPKALQQKLSKASLKVKTMTTNLENSFKSFKATATPKEQEAIYRVNEALYRQLKLAETMASKNPMDAESFELSGRTEILGENMDKVKGMLLDQMAELDPGKKYDANDLLKKYLMSREVMDNATKLQARIAVEKKTGLDFEDVVANYEQALANYKKIQNLRATKSRQLGKLKERMKTHLKSIKSEIKAMGRDAETTKEDVKFAKEMMRKHYKAKIKQAKAHIEALKTPEYLQAKAIAEGYKEYKDFVEASQKNHYFDEQGTGFTDGEVYVYEPVHWSPEENAWKSSTITSKAGATDIGGYIAKANTEEGARRMADQISRQLNGQRYTGENADPDMYVMDAVDINGKPKGHKAIYKRVRRSNDFTVDKSKRDHIKRLLMSMGNNGTIDADAINAGIKQLEDEITSAKKLADDGLLNRAAARDMDKLDTLLTDVKEMFKGLKDATGVTNMPAEKVRSITRSLIHSLERPTSGLRTKPTNLFHVGHWKGKHVFNGVDFTPPNITKHVDDTLQDIMTASEYQAERNAIRTGIEDQMLTLAEIGLGNSPYYKYLGDKLDQAEAIPYHYRMYVDPKKGKTKERDYGSWVTGTAAYLGIGKLAFQPFQYIKNRSANFVLGGAVNQALGGNFGRHVLDQIKTSTLQIPKDFLKATSKAVGLWDGHAAARYMDLANNYELNSIGDPLIREAFAIAREGKVMGETTAKTVAETGVNDKLSLTLVFTTLAEMQNRRATFLTAAARYKKLNPPPTDANMKNAYIQDMIAYAENSIALVDGKFDNFHMGGMLSKLSGSRLRAGLTFVKPMASALGAYKTFWDVAINNAVKNNDLKGVARMTALSSLATLATYHGVSMVLNGISNSPIVGDIYKVVDFVTSMLMNGETEEALHDDFGARMDRRLRQAWKEAGLSEDYYGYVKKLFTGINSDIIGYNGAMDESLLNAVDIFSLGVIADVGETIGKTAKKSDTESAMSVLLHGALRTGMPTFAYRASNSAISTLGADKGMTFDLGKSYYPNRDVNLKDIAMYIIAGTPKDVQTEQKDALYSINTLSTQKQREDFIRKMLSATGVTSAWLTDAGIRKASITDASDKAPEFKEEIIAQLEGVKEQRKDAEILIEEYVKQNYDRIVAALANQSSAPTVRLTEKEIMAKAMQYSSNFWVAHSTAAAASKVLDPSIAEGMLRGIQITMPEQTDAQTAANYAITKAEEYLAKAESKEYFKKEEKDKTDKGGRGRGKRGGRKMRGEKSKKTYEYDGDTDVRDNTGNEE